MSGNEEAIAMTDQDPTAGTAPEGEPFQDQPGAGTPPEPDHESEAGAGRAREWLTQLESMIQQISTQAAPVARQVGAKAAELAAVAAVKAGPVAQKAASLTTDYGQRFAEKAQSVAAELRSQDGHADAATNDTEAAPGGAPVATMDPAPEDTTGSGL
jgi:hypothetical protein